MSKFKQWIEKLKKPQWFFFAVIILFMIVTITVKLSFALFSTRVEKSGTLNIVAGDFSYTVSSSDLTNNQITVKPAEEKIFEVTITNINDRDTSYELYYRLVSPSTLPNNVEIGYANTTVDAVKENEIKKGTTKTVQLVVRNHSTESITLEIGAQGGFVGKTLVLEKGKSLNKKIMITADDTSASVPELEENMIPVKYDEPSKKWVKADQTNPFTNPWYQYQNKMWANAVTVDQNKVIDISGNDHSGTLHGATITSGQAYLDGKDDYINCGLEQYNFHDQISFVLKMKVTYASDTKDQPMFGNWDGGGGGLAQNSGTIYINLYINGSYRHARAATPSNDNNVHVMVGTYDGTALKLYYDGVKISEIPMSGEIGISTMPILLGANPDRENGNMIAADPVNLNAYETLVFNRALSEEEVSKNYRSDIKVTDPTGLLLHYNFKKGNDIEVNTPISMDAINMMMVWVPRYKYAMPAAKEGQVDIVFENKDTAKSTGIATGTSYLTHPAFTFGTTELNGLWVGKFESSSDTTCTTSTGAQGTNCDLTSIKPQIKPNVKSWTGARVSTFFTASRNVQAAGNPYGYSQSGMNTHMMKNSEWGAVAYLTQSKYGRCTNGTCTEVTINNLNSGDGRTITGCAADTITASELKQADCPDTNRYNTEKGVLASTTGNIYGIYDMSGGNWEYTMGNYNKYSGYTAISYTAEQATTILGRTDGKSIGIWNSGFNGPVFGKALDNSTALSWTTGIDFPKEKYYDLYTTNNVLTSCNGKLCLGHALSETAGWNGDYQYQVTSSTVWFIRGGGYGNGTGAGILSFSNSYGYAGISISSRLVVSRE